jgi:hypothetical protein
VPPTARRESADPTEGQCVPGPGGMKYRDDVSVHHLALTTRQVGQLRLTAKSHPSAMESTMQKSWLFVSASFATGDRHLRRPQSRRSSFHRQ